MKIINFNGVDTPILEWNTEELVKFCLNWQGLIDKMPYKLLQKCGSLNSMPGCMLNTQTGKKEIVKFYFN